MTPIRIYGEQYVHKSWAVNNFLEYHSLSSSINHFQVLSCFHHSAGDLNFYQLYFSANQNLYNYATWKYNIMNYTCNTKVWHAAIFGQQWFSQNDNFQCYPLVHAIFIYRYMYEEIFDFCFYNLGERFPNKT